MSKQVRHPPPDGEQLRVNKDLLFFHNFFRLVFPWCANFKLDDKVAKKEPERPGCCHGPTQTRGQYAQWARKHLHRESLRKCEFL